MRYHRELEKKRGIWRDRTDAISLEVTLSDELIWQKCLFFFWGGGGGEEAALGVSVW